MRLWISRCKNVTTEVHSFLLIELDNTVGDTSVPEAHPLLTSCQRLLFIVSLHLGDQNLQLCGNKDRFSPSLMRIKGSVKIVTIHIADDWQFLIADLLVSPNDDQKKPAEHTPSEAIYGELA